eukprot:m51a1_g1207 hypothetical protein (399) ;mRNA; f:467898-469094
MPALAPRGRRSLVLVIVAVLLASVPFFWWESSPAPDAASLPPSPAVSVVASSAPHGSDDAQQQQQQRSGDALGPAEGLPRLSGPFGMAPMANLTRECGPRAAAGGQQRLAYALYVTNDLYAALGAMNARRLALFGMRAGVDVVAIVAHGVGHGARRALREAGVCRLYEVEALTTQVGTQWQDSVTKLYVLGLGDYDKVVYFDADGLVVGNSDFLFDTPVTPERPVAMPLSYWISYRWYTSIVIVLLPSKQLEAEALKNFEAQGGYDMEVMNHAFSPRTVTLPQKVAVLSGVFDPEAGGARFFGGKSYAQILAETTYIHASQGYNPNKPWYYKTEQARKYDEQPGFEYTARFGVACCRELLALQQAYGMSLNPDPRHLNGGCKGWERWWATANHSKYPL